MGGSQETSNKKEVRSKKEKKRQEKEKKRILKKDSGSTRNPDDMIAYVDEYGRISSTPVNTSKEKINPENIEISTPKRNPGPRKNPVRKGIVTYFNDSKGFGFIRDLETQDSVFVHINNFLEEIVQGNVVSFEIENGPRGAAAVLVKLFKEEPPAKT